ncbi:MAG: HEAT repeat domain-containing protein [Calditrichaeota bacterium]|nr:HEAT repeat domain-containing protein [Calditrichota bacterium]
MRKLLTVALMALMLVGVGMAKDSKTSDNHQLIQFLKDDNIGIRSSAAQLLGERKVKEAVEPLIQMLKNAKNFRMRIVVAVALHKIGDQRALPVLKKVAVNDPNKTVRRVVSGLVNDFEKTRLTNL